MAKPGRFALTAWKPGFLHRRDDETLREVGRNGQSFSYRLERGSSVRGRIHEFDDQPVSGATVFASVSSLSNGFCWGISTSAEDGSFEISGLPTDARRAMLIARHPDFAPTMERPDNTAEFQVMTMGKGRGLICTLFDAATGEELPDGLPVKLDFESPESGSGIWLGRAMPTAAAEVRGGSFLVEGIPDFVGSVRLSCAGYAPGRVDLSGEREDTILRTLQLAHLRRHVVIVIDGSTGERVDGAEVTLWTGERGADGAINRTSTWNLPASVAPEGIEFHIADHYLPAEGECSIQVSGPRHSTVRHLFQRTDLEARAPWVVRLDRHD